jgi:arginyl-tRNA synthetase
MTVTSVHLYLHCLCAYRFRVDKQLHVFYKSCRVLGDAFLGSRLVLRAATHALRHPEHVSS